MEKHLHTLSKLNIFVKKENTSDYTLRSLRQAPMPHITICLMTSVNQSDKEQF